MKFLRKFRSAEEYAEYIRTADSSNMHLAPTISLLAFGDEEKPKVGYVNADLTFKFTTEMEYEERWFSTRGGGDYSMSTFEGVSGQTYGGIVKQAYLDGKLYYVNNNINYDDDSGGGSSPNSLRYNASTPSQSSWWDGIIVKEPGQHILQLVLDKTGVEDEFIVGNTGFMNIDELYIDDIITGLEEYFIDGNVGTIYIPETLNYIGNNVFGEGVNSIQIHENNLYFESISNDNGLIDKGSGTLFYANKNATEFVIPEGVKGIADNVFYYASDLVSITFPSTLEWIGSYVFYECRELTGELVIPDSVTSIGSQAFEYCSGLTSVEIGSGCTSIGSEVFRSCSGLESIAVSSGNAVYDSRENCNCIIETNTNTLISGCKNSFIPDSVTSIGYYAFQNCSGLTSVIIPDSVTSIGSNAFSYCYGLTSIEIGSGCTSIGNYAFQSCSGLTEITCHATTVPSISNRTFQNVKSNGILYIPANSSYSTWLSTSSYYLGFYNWFGLEIGTEKPELVFEDYDVAILFRPVSNSSVKRICYSTNNIAEIKVNDTILDSVSTGYTFTPGMWNVVRIKYTDGTTSIPPSCFRECTYMHEVKIADSVKSIDSSAFQGCSGLTSFEIGSGVTSIGNSSFYGCSGLTGKLIIPDSVTSIGSFAFYNCSGLTSVEIGSGCTSIDHSAFSGCKGLTNAEIGSGVTSIGDYAFQECSSLTGELVIPDSVTSIGNYAFQNCSGLKTVVIPDSVTSIGYSVFYNCSGLKTVVIPDSVTSINSSTFYGCTNLSSIVIPDSVTYIGDRAFYYCYRLTSLEIGSGCTSIGSNAFYNCYELAEITCHATTAPSIYSNTFYYVKSNGTLYVPSGSDYSSWMNTNYSYLGYYNWTQQSIS